MEQTPGPGVNGNEVIRKTERSMASYRKKNDGGDTKDQEVQVRF